MVDVDDFLAFMIPRLEDVDTALHNGDAGPRSALWSHANPVTLFGAAATVSGWVAIKQVFDWLGSTFTDCGSFKYEVIAAGLSGDLAYVVGIEHTTASVKGAAPVTYELRVTTIFRREHGEWKIVHRHGDPVPGAQNAGPGVGLFDRHQRS
jgi:ketosteroid isomerase-like protein